ncbi:class I SAM-dependent methyltransferase [Microbaculum marinum]|uniref:Class I SAM-dependent methyltransferase n=1 Tax=Microbaculum marinum TaxID=1764581 RepID=A0AAW9RXZ0_9HYPH
MTATDPNDREFLPFDTVLARALGDLAGLAVADIGCGSGAVTRRLARLGAEVTGVEPNAAQVAVAEEKGAEEKGSRPRYVVAPAEATGLEPESFDLALFSRSLHHAGDMAAALAEARRIVRPGGRIAVLEPEAAGPFHPVMAFVDDEAPVYAQAQAALDAAVAAGDLTRAASLRFATKCRARDAEAMLADLITVDNGRSLADADRPAFEAAFAAALVPDDKGGHIPDFSRIDVFTRT